MSAEYGFEDWRELPPPIPSPEAKEQSRPRDADGQGTKNLAEIQDLCAETKHRIAPIDFLDV